MTDIDPVDDKRYKNEEWLREQYHDLQKSISDVAELANVANDTIMRWMKRHDIERRSIAEAKSKADITPLKNPEWVQEQYWTQEKTLAEIGDEVGVSASTVRSWMDRHDIEARSNSEAQSDGDIELYTDASWLQQRYLDEERSLVEVGELAGVSTTTIKRWMNKHDIETRSTAEAMSEGNLAPLRDSDWLEKQYHERGRTAVEIGSKLGLSETPVLRWLERHEIERRDPHSSAVQSDGNVDPLNNSE